MKKISLFAAFICCNLFVSQTPCVNGKAGIYPCKNFDLQSVLTNSQIGGDSTSEGSSIWGWTDSQTKKEYAIYCLDSHIAFIDITNATKPVYLGKLPTETESTIWRDVRVYKDHAFVVSEATDHGMQVFDLKRLRGVIAPQTFTADTVYKGFGKCHTIEIDVVNGFAYGVGTRTYSGGPHIVNIKDPKNPVLAGGFSGEGYTHEAQVVVYNGPDVEHRGKQIFMGSNESNQVVLDVTDKSNIKVLSVFNYPNTSYTHQGCFTEDQRYFLLGDELDEQEFFFNSKTIVIDYTDLDKPVLKFNYFGPTKAADHNGYVLGKEFYLANWRAGIRGIDIKDINSSKMTEFAFFDTYPSSDSSELDGAWNVYPYFPSKNIIVSTVKEGLFVIRKTGALNNDSYAQQKATIYPNPGSDIITISMETAINSVNIVNVLGEKVESWDNIFTNEFKFNVSDYSKGVYMININNNINQKLVVE